jgi:hypothetical protein
VLTAAGSSSTSSSGIVAATGPAAASYSATCTADAEKLAVVQGIGHAQLLDDVFIQPSYRSYPP